MKGLVNELEDSNYELLNSIYRSNIDCKLSFNSSDAFIDVQYAFLIASAPFKTGMIRRDFLNLNSTIYAEQGKCIEKYANKDIKVLVIANPANTNAWVCMKNAPSIPKQNFTSLSRLDYNRSAFYVKEKIESIQKIRASYHDIKNIIIWGNHSDLIYPDITHCTYKNQLIKDISEDFNENSDEFIEYIRSRAPNVINLKGSSTFTCAAKASADHMRDWIYGTSGIL